MIDILAKDKNNLHQSKEWAEFQESLGRKAHFFSDLSIFLFKYPLYKNKKYLYCARGPVIRDRESVGKLKDAVQELTVLDKDLIFLRIEPVIAKAPNLDFHRGAKTQSNFLRIISDQGFIKPKVVVQQHSPENTLVLNITKPDEETLAQMKPKTRYNIGLSSRKGVEVKQGINSKDIDIFYNLSLEVSKRDSSFSPHPKEYYEKMVEILGAKGIVKIFTAFYKKRPLAAILVSFYGEVATYLHGGSSNEDRELMPTYLVQWEAVREAQKRGCKAYDFWGVAPEQEGENHPWAGISRFKRGFGGEEVNFPGTWDYVFDPFWYKSLSFASKVKHILKR